MPTFISMFITVLFTILAVLLTFILALIAPYIKGFLKARTIQDKHGNRLQFVSRFPSFPTGDFFTMCRNQFRKDQLRAKGGYRASPAIEGMYFFNSPTVIVRDHESMQKVFFKPGELYERRSDNFIISFLKQFLPNGISQVDGEKWGRIHRLAARAFTPSAMTELVPHVVEHTQEFLLSAAEISARNGESVEVSEILERLTGFVMGEGMFGLSRESVPRFLSVWHKTMKEMRDPVLFLFGGWSFLPPMQRLQQSKEELKSFLVQEVNRVRGDFEAGHGTNAPLLIQLLKGDEDGTLTDEELSDNLITLMIAGYETTATFLMRILVEIAKHDDVQKKLREEILSTLGGERKITYSAITNMKYLDQVFRETMRYYPTGVGTVPRYMPQDIELEDYTIPRGIGITWDWGALSSDESIYPNAKAFDPEHFSQENESKRPPNSYFPFGLGSRMCIGSRLAMTEIKTAVVTLIRKYSIRPDPSEKWELDKQRMAVTLTNLYFFFDALTE